jgi:3-phosphoshikimate 1-carboxyvinyltransferase
LRNIASWRVKETDRIAAMATELRKLGAAVEEGADFLVITPPTGSGAVPSAPTLCADAAIDTYDDHRMAMSLALVGLRVPGVLVADPACVGKTFPDYWDRLDAITRA